MPITCCLHLSSMAREESRSTALSMPALPPHMRLRTASPAPPSTATLGKMRLQSSNGLAAALLPLPIFCSITEFASARLSQCFIAPAINP